jgi:hypothetical protein
MPLLIQTPAPTHEELQSPRELAKLVDARMKEVKSLEIEKAYTDFISPYQDSVTRFQIQIPGQRAALRNYLSGRVTEEIFINDHAWFKTNDLFDGEGNRRDQRQWVDFGQQEKISWDSTGSPLSRLTSLDFVTNAVGISRRLCGEKSCYLITAQRPQKDFLPDADILILFDPESLLIRNATVITYEVGFDRPTPYRVGTTSVSNYEFRSYDKDFGIKPPK